MMKGTVTANNVIKGKISGGEVVRGLINKFTAEQIGLGNVDNTSDMDKPVSTAQAEAIADAKKAGTDAQGDIDAHVGNKNNPHDVTIKQIGAAPAGYGLGVKTTETVNNLNTCVNNGWYSTGQATANVPAGFEYSSVFVETRIDRITQKLTTLRDNGIGVGTVLIRTSTDNGETWTEEWENPPLKPGVEYRTTERCDGKPVYRKLVVYTHSGKFGDSATSTDYTIPHGISDWVRSVRCVTSINNDVTGSYLGSTGGILCAYGFGATNINVRAYKTYFNSPIFRFDLAYIKE